MEDGLYYRGQRVPQMVPEEPQPQLMRYGQPMPPNLMQPVDQTPRLMNINQPQQQPQPQQGNNMGTIARLLMGGV